MALDTFFQLMEQAVSLHRYNPIHANHNHISNLIFADDLFIVGKLDLTSINSFNSAFESIAMYLGLRLNKEKSVYFIVENCRAFCMLENILKIKKGSPPFK